MAPLVRFFLRSSGPGLAAAPGASLRAGPSGAGPLLGVLLLGVVVLALHGVGVFERFDARVVARVVDQLPASDRAEAPVLLALGAPTVEAWGGPPWPIERWRSFAAALGEAGVREAWLVDPLDRVLLPPSEPVPPPDPSWAALHVPRQLHVLPDGSVIPVPDTVVEPGPPFKRWDAHLLLPLDKDGIFRGLSELSNAEGLFGTSAFCAWARRCPSGGPLSQVVPTGRPDTALPAISAVDVLEGRVDLSDMGQQGRIFLIGVTVPWYTQQLRVGSEATPLSWAEAVGMAITAARTRAPTPDAGPGADVAMILTVMVLGLVLHRQLWHIGEGWLVILLPGGVLVAGVLLLVNGLVVPPIGACVVMAAAAPALSMLRVWRRSSGLVHRAIREIDREAFRYAARAGQIESTAVLLKVLGAFSRCYTRSGRCLYLHRRGRGGALEVVGGFVLTAGSLGDLPLDLDHPALSAAARSPEGAQVPGLLKDPGWVAHVVPLLQHGQVVGLWCVAFEQGEKGPDPGLLADIARWLSPRLALEPGGWRPWVDAWMTHRLDHELVMLEERISATSEERHWHLEIMDALSTPLMVTDIAGVVLVKNRALEHLLHRSGLGHIHTLRELIFKLTGEQGLQERMQRLFGNLHAQHFPWRSPSREDWTVRVYPVKSGVGGAATGVVGFVAQFERAAPARPEGELPQVVELSDVLHSALGAVDSKARERGVQIRISLPPLPTPVSLVPERAAPELAALLQAGVRSQAEGGVLDVSAVEGPRHMELKLRWAGPGLDEGLLRRLGESPIDGEDLEELKVFRSAAEAFPGLVVSSSPGRGVTISLPMNRADAA